MFPTMARARERLRESVWIDGRSPVLVAVSVGWFLVLGVRLVIPALFPQIRAAFALDNTVAGSMYTVLLLTAALFQFPGGVAADRAGGRSVLLAGFGATFAAVVLLASAPGVAVFLLGIVLFGIGTGLYGTPRITVLSGVYPDRDGTAIGICSAAGNVGTSALPVVAGVVAAALGWRYGFGFVLPAFALAALLIWRYVPAGADRTGDAPIRERARGIARGMHDRAVLTMTGIMMVTFFVYQGVTAFLPTYLVEVKSLSGPLAATLLGGFFAGGIVFQVIGGGLADRYGRRRVLSALVVVSAAGILSLPFAIGLGWLVVVVLVASVQLGVWPIAFSYAVAALPEEVEAGSLGLLRSAYLLVGSTGSAVVGVFADADAFDLAFLVLGGLALVTAGACLGLPASPDRAS